ncbi:hypothetical protein PESP_b0699 [Pseudoalteromonas espejiana DSM 9414]|uniref:Uncharacterized protein n=2 Tax=Pseudoalteromonas espejiana TaxID=28107 RepID=A0A510XRJ9_9GAMM|nr:hypothetical protein [Pseudoalteromonas espejiana]ASM52224.1 hypothetical protein PESP_b0699 [Pseudoalteromonas espejiana DSM 9414]GEK53640.1 hypothetical protein PES01_04850 [Pseudoalteromonas espejiana]
MKKMIILIASVISIGYYLNAKASQSSFKKETEVKTFSDIYYKIETSSVSIDEIIIGATEFALTMCADRSYQEALGNTVQSCNHHFKMTKDRCASYLIKNSQRFYKDKTKVTLLTERFINCVS